MLVIALVDKAVCYLSGSPVHKVITSALLPFISGLTAAAGLLLFNDSRLVG